MKRYETIIIIDPDLSKEVETPILERVNDLIPQFKGFLIETDDWGTKKLAYEIKKKSRGHYVRFEFCGDGPLIQEMERFFRIDDKVLKFMTVLIDKAADLDTIKTELAEKEAAKAEKEAAKEQAPAKPENTEKADTPEAPTENIETPTEEKEEE